MDETALVKLGHTLAQAGAELLELDVREVGMVVDPLEAGRQMVCVFDADGHGGGHMAELFSRGESFLAPTRQLLCRSATHDEMCRTAYIM